MKNEACNKYLLKDGDSYRGLPECETHAEAVALRDDRGWSGEVVTRKEYQDTRGKVDDKKQSKMERLAAKLEGMEILECIDESALNATGKRYLKISRKIKQLQAAIEETEIDAIDPDSD